MWFNKVVIEQHMKTEQEKVCLYSNAIQIILKFSFET